MFTMNIKIKYFTLNIKIKNIHLFHFKFVYLQILYGSIGILIFNIY